MSLRPIALSLGVLLAASCGGGSLKPDGGGGGDAQASGDPATSLRAALAGAWAFDGDGKDHSGQNLELTVEGLSFPDGKFGKGALFAGTDSSPIAHRNVDDASLNLTTGDFTVSLWVNFTKTASPQFLAVKGYVAEQGWFVGWAQTAWGFGYPPPGRAVKIDATPTEGVFHHVVFERMGDMAELYVDEQHLGGITVQDRAAPGASSFQVGGFSSGGLAGAQNVVNGIVDDVAIWHRALTGSERSYLATHGVP